MKKLLSFALAFILLIGSIITISAANPTTIYKYIIEKGEVTITKIETSKDVINIPEKIEGYPVTGIDSDAFFNLFRFGEFEAINIPASVKNIETPIVFDKVNVNAINIDENNSVYSSENGILFNKNKTTLLYYPCKNKAEKYVVPESVVRIEDYAFRYARFYNIELPENLEEIGENAFYKSGNLEKLHLPKNVKSIGKNALILNYNLSEVTAAKANPYFSSVDGVLFSKDKTELLYYPVAKIGTTYNVPEGVKVIGHRAFQALSPLNLVTLPEGLERIEERGFCGCSKVTIPKLPDSLEYIGFEAFSNCSFIDLVIPEKVTEIGDSAFRVSDNINTVYLPDGMKKIGNEAFAWNYKLEKVNFPEGLDEIGTAAFMGCSSLDEVTIPASVTTIGENAFEECGENFKIYGYEGTIAEKVADEYGYEFIALDHNYTAGIIGDVTLDGKLNIRDATLLQKHLANIVALGDTALSLADFDQNGKINIRDATAIQKDIAGIK